MKIIMLGAPGAGKGTQAQILNDRYSIPTISTGAIIRSAIKNETPTGKMAKAYIEKGELMPEESAYLKKYGSAWGCDLCQLACPLNREVLRQGMETPIDFFRKERIAYLTTETLGAMSDADFKRRAFSWRGKATLMRNLELLSEE